jgi:hypothetical protein
MIVYTIKEYVQSKSSLDDKIKAIEQLIENMLLNSVEAIDNSGVASFIMDDGQMRINTEYRSVDEITKGIRSLERVLQMYINRRNGHTVILRGKLNY